MESLPLIQLLSTQPGAAVAWEPFREGIEIVRLARSVDGGPAAALLRYRPGARLPRHFHPAAEHVLILSGAQTDDAGRHVAGELLAQAPGSSHAIASDEGCVVLIIWEKPVVFDVEPPPPALTPKPPKPEAP